MMQIDGLLSQLAAEEYCYLTTTGRNTGRPHEIEIWFAASSTTVYMLSGSEKSDWLRNLLKNASVAVRIARHTFAGTARLVEDPEEDATARDLIAGKYHEWEEGRTLSQWARTAVPVAIDVHSVDSP